VFAACGFSSLPQLQLPERGMPRLRFFFSAFEHYRRIRNPATAPRVAIIGSKFRERKKELGHV
jgi:hypothetical protein